MYLARTTRTLLAFAIIGQLSSSAAVAKSAKRSATQSTQPARQLPTDAPAQLAVTKEPADVAGPVLRFERVVLTNGVEGLLLPDHAAPMVGVFAIVRAGLVFEGPGEDGLSHFLEHLLFNGTDKYSQEELYAAVDAIGGYSNATTRRDHTLFQMLVPRQHLERALSLHVEMLFHSTLPANKFEKERGIVLEEIARDSASPSTQLDDAFRRIAWSGSPLGRPTLGSPDTIRSIERDRVVAYWQRAYVPHHVTVLVVGDCDVARFRQVLESTYGMVPAQFESGIHRDGRMTAVAASRLHTVHIDGPADAPVEMLLAWAGPAATHPDVAAQEVLAAVLTTDSSLGLKGLLGESGLTVTDASATVEVAAGATTFVVRVTAAADTVPQRLAQETARLVATAADAVTDDTLAGIALRHALEAASLAERPHYFGIEKSTALVNSGVGAVEGESIAIESVRPSNVRNARKRWLQQPFVAIAGGPGLTAGKQVLADAATTASTTADRAAHQQTVKLANGATLHVQSTPGASLFATHVLIRGRGVDSADDGGRAELLARLLPVFPGVEQRLQRIGGRLKTHDDPNIPYDDYYNVPDYGYIRLEALDVFADESSELVGTLLRAADAVAGIDATLVDQAVAELRAAAARDDLSPAAQSRQLLRDALYGASHPLAQATGKLRDAVVDREQLAEFARRYLDPSQLIVTVHTGLEPAQVIAKLTRVLAALPTQPRSRPTSPMAPSQPSSREVGLASTQSYARLGQTVVLTPKQRPAMELAVAILSERLAMDIREGRGMAYSIGAGLEVRGVAGPDVWSASAGTRPENIDEVSTAMRNIVAELSTRPPTAVEASLAASRTQGRALMRRLSAMGRAWADGLDLLHGDPPGTSLKETEELDRVKLEDLLEAIHQHMDPNTVSIVIVRARAE